jgi:hypothetical protein
MSSTSLLLNVGAFGPALRAGNPVTGSVTSLTRCSRFFRGVNTIRPFSILASSGSPARISSRRRSGPGRTTCPLVETLVCTVRQSYHRWHYTATDIDISFALTRNAGFLPLCHLTGLGHYTPAAHHLQLRSGHHLEARPNLEKCTNHEHFW